MAENTLQALHAAIEKGQSFLRKEVTPRVVELAFLVQRWGDHLDVIEKTIRFKDGEYCVIGESGKNFGCYDSKPKAEARLRQIERFSKAAEVHGEALFDVAEALLGDELTEPDGLPSDAIAVATAAHAAVRILVAKAIAPEFVDACKALEPELAEFIKDGAGKDPAAPPPAPAPVAEDVEKQAPKKGLDREKLEAMRQARSKQFGIEVLEEGSNLSFPKGFPEKLEQYGDPVNLKFPVETKARAANARVRFKQFADRYAKATSKRVVHTRIVEAELKLGIKPDISDDDALDKLLPAALRERAARAGEKEAAYHGMPDRRRRRRGAAAKGLPGYQAEGGIHIHGAERENSKTKRDGQHSHMFTLTKTLDLGDGIGVLPAGYVLITEEDGAHEHELGSEAADNTAKGGEHFHRVRLPGGKIFETTEDGVHAHQMQVISSAFDGLHQHVLELPNQKMKSMSPGQIWEVQGSYPQVDYPPLPPASTFAWPHPNMHSEMAIMRGVERLKSADGGGRLEAERSGFRKGEIAVLKLPDPEFILKQLVAGKPAGIVSTRCRKSRLGEPQALVNELGPGHFERSFVWGFVSYGEAELYKSIEDMPDETRSGVDSHSRREFNGVPDVYYMPLKLVKALDEPLRLREAPAGRRFAGKIDLATDAVQVRKCANCPKSFESNTPEMAVCATCRKTAAAEQAGTVEKRGAGGQGVSYAVRIVKAAEDEDLGERYIKGIVLVPEVADAQGDIYDHEEVRKAAHTFMEVSKGRMKVMHKGEQVDELIVLETYLSTVKERYDDEEFPVGTWFMGFRAPAELHKRAKSGEFTGLSIGGSAIREALD